MNITDNINNLSRTQIKEYLDELNHKYNNADFVADDPISVPHRYTDHRDIEIAGFLASTIAWGQRRTIVKNAHRMVEMMDDAPFDFVTNHTQSDLRALEGFVHRTFNDHDFMFFVSSLKNVYDNHGGIGQFFQNSYAQSQDLRLALSEFRSVFLGDGAPSRTSRHVSNIDKGATCKRLLMYLKWMVRKDNLGVDFGIWDKIPSSALYLPIDVHSGNTARLLGLLERKQNDWRAVEEITSVLREFDANDPVQYDFALFCAGIYGELK